MNTKTLIVDAMNIAYKSYFRMPHLSNKKGNTSSTVYGFLTQLNKLYNTYKPENVVICWDSRNSVRKELDPTYKVRPKPKDEKFEQFIGQVLQLKKAFPKIGIPSLELDGYESDDIMAVLMHRAELKPAVVCTTDNDLYQCLEQDVKIWDGKSEIDVEILHLMFGLTPRLYTVYKAIKGCGTDTVKGIPGYGEKTTLKLIKECDFDIDKIYKKIDALGYAKQFDHALELVVLPFGMDYNLPLEVKQLNIDKKQLVEFLYQYNINSIEVSKFLNNN